MTYIYYALICLTLIVFQTSVVPCLMPSHFFYDALIPFIVYLGVFQPGYGSFAFLLVLGLIMDGLSGGAYGVYLATYVWLYAGVRLLGRIFRLRNSVILLIILVSGVCLENAVFWGSILLSGQGARMYWFPIQSIGMQVLWTALAGLILIKIFETLQKLWSHRIRALRTGKTNVLG